MGLTIKARRTLVNVEHRAYTRQTLRMTIALRVLIRKNPVLQRTRFSRPYFFQSRIAQEGVKKECRRKFESLKLPHNGIGMPTFAPTRFATVGTLFASTITIPRSWNSPAT